MKVGMFRLLVRRLLTANLSLLLGFVGLQAQDHAQLRLENIFVYNPIDVPGGVFIDQFVGFRAEGSRISFMHHKIRKGKPPATEFYSFSTEDGAIQPLQLPASVQERILPILTKSRIISLRPERQAYGLMENAELGLQLNGEHWIKASPNGACINDVHIHTHDTMLFGHVCYPYPDIAQGISSGLYRWHARTGIFDSVRIPRKHLYITHLRKDNAWSALLNDSLCVMADITGFNVWIAGSKGEARTLELKQPPGWVQYPDSLERVYQRIKLSKGTLAAWDSLGNWLNRYSRIEKIWANKHGGVALRYTALNLENKLASFIQLYQLEGSNLTQKETIPLRGWPEQQEEITKDNFSSLLLGNGNPTFFMDDRSFVALDAVPEGYSLLGVKTKKEVARYENAAILRQKKMAAYVYRMD